MAPVVRILASLLLFWGGLSEGESAMEKKWWFGNILSVKFHEDIVNGKEVAMTVLRNHNNGEYFLLISASSST